MEKIVQTAGRNALGEFAPEFAHFNDDVLFGENWNNQDIDVKTRSIITVVALMASGITDSSLKPSHCLNFITYLLIYFCLFLGSYIIKSHNKYFLEIIHNKTKALLFF